MKKLIPEIIYSLVSSIPKYVGKQAKSCSTLEHRPHGDLLPGEKAEAQKAIGVGVRSDAESRMAGSLGLALLIFSAAQVQAVPKVTSTVILED